MAHSDSCTRSSQRACKAIAWTTCPYTSITSAVSLDVQHSSLRIPFDSLHEMSAMAFAIVIIILAQLQGLLASDNLCIGKKIHVCEGMHMLDLTVDAACSTHNSLGLAIGKQFRENIVERINKVGPQLQKALAYVQTEEGNRTFEGLKSASLKAFPLYWEELQGIAEGSKLPLQLILILNFRQELSILAEGGEDQQGLDDCSDVMLRSGGRGGAALLGHNEDNTEDTVNTTYFVQAKLGWMAEQDGRSWTAYTYAGELSTAAWGFNDAGLSFTLNAVYATWVDASGVGRNFVARSVLDATSFQDALRRITRPQQATGHNINLMSIDGLRVATIETAPGNVSSIKELINETYFHANAYLRLNTSQNPGPSSEHREKRAAELPVPTDRSRILNILGDTEDKKYPIYRSGSDGVFTLCTAFFNLRAETVEIFFANPKSGLNSIVSLPLLQGGKGHSTTSLSR